MSGVEGANESCRAIALILAAGRSTRMGSCKAALPWIEGKTLLTYQVQQWLLADVLPIVVLNSQNAWLQATLPPICRTVINPDSDAGKTSSILTGLAALPFEWRVLAIAAVDQPRPAWIYQTLLQAQHPYKITAPVYGDRIGHPILFRHDMLPQLQAIQEEQLGVRQVMQEFEADIHLVNIADPIVLADLNTLEAYQSWQQQYL